MTDAPRQPVRRWRGFAALSGPDGPLIWGSLRPTEEDARRYFENHNPMRPAEIVQIELKITAEAKPSRPKDRAEGV